MKSIQQPILGIDISTSSVKIIQLSSSGNENRCVEAYASLSLPDNAIDGAIIKDIDAVADTISKVVSIGGFSSKQAAVAVPDALAISKVIQITEGLSVSDIEELVVIEADKYIPYPIDEINIDFNVLGPSAKNAALRDVLIVASRAEHVNSRVEAVRRAGLESKIVDVESYAVERSAQLLKDDLPAGGENKVIAIVDVGSVYTHLFVLQNMKMIYSRDEEFGGKHLIESIAHQYEISYSDALLSMINNTLPDDFHSRVLQPFQEKLFIEVKRTLQFFFSSSQYSFIDKIILTGGVARQREIAPLLQERMGVPTSIGNPLAKMTISKMVNSDKVLSESPSLMIACGLALRHIE